MRCAHTRCQTPPPAPPPTLNTRRSPKNNLDTERSKNKIYLEVYQTKLAMATLNTVLGNVDKNIVWQVICVSCSAFFSTVFHPRSPVSLLWFLVRRFSVVLFLFDGRFSLVQPIRHQIRLFGAWSCFWLVSISLRLGFPFHLLLHILFLWTVFRLCQPSCHEVPTLALFGFAEIERCTQ